MGVSLGLPKRSARSSRRLRRSLEDEVFLCRRFVLTRNPLISNRKQIKRPLVYYASARRRGVRRFGGKHKGDVRLKNPIVFQQEEVVLHSHRHAADDELIRRKRTE